MLSQPENAMRELTGGKAKATPTAEDAFADGPQLVTPASAEADATAGMHEEIRKVEATNWQSREAPAIDHAL